LTETRNKGCCDQKKKKKHLVLNKDTATEKQSDSQLGGLDVSGRPLDGVAVVAGELGDNLQQGGTVVFYRLAVVIEPCLVLGAQRGHTGLELWQAIPDVMHEQPAESFGQIARAGPRGERGVVALQESLLVPRRVRKALLGIDVMLAPSRITIRGGGQ